MKRELCMDTVKALSRYLIKSAILTVTAAANIPAAVFGRPWRKWESGSD